MHPTLGSLVHPLDGFPGAPIRWVSWCISLDGSLVHPLDGSLVHPLDGSLVHPLDGSLVHPLDGSLVHLIRWVPGASH